MYKNSQVLLYVITVMMSTITTVLVAILIVTAIVATMFLLTEMSIVKIVSMSYTAIVKVVEKLPIETIQYTTEVKSIVRVVYLKLLY
jgi:hypothetical protein